MKSQRWFSFSAWLVSFSARVASLWVPGEKPGYQSQASLHLKAR
jgi:hypothetical protein